jgi:ubiquinone/menaquinone biosynthesis C-methylase UbiE
MDPSDLYLQVRVKEGRVYTDRLVLRLPAIPTDHPHKKEWSARADSANRLENYLMRLRTPLYILELGCGNGWLTHKISTIPGVNIWGVDRKGPELTQAARLFNSSKAGFISTNIFESPFIQNSFDVIVLASVIQYFRDIHALILKLQSLLTNHGEIHIIDSPIYHQKDFISARERTFSYYSILGFSEMADNYFHHTIDEINEFSPRWLYKPDRWQVRMAKLVGKSTSPFPWLCIR